MERLESETEFYSSGFWFEYDTVEKSNLIINEKLLKGIVFPKEPKTRDYIESEVKTKTTGFKWLT